MKRQGYKLRNEKKMEKRKERVRKQEYKLRN